VLTRPIVVLRPVRPHHDAGNRTEPPVSVPIAQGVNPAATATPEPLLDPPGVRATAGSHGFHGVPRCWLVPHCELDRMRFTDHDQTGSDQPFCQRCRIARAPFSPDLRAAGRNPPLDLDQILERDRDPVERADPVPRADRLVGRFGGEPGLLVIYFDKGVQFPVRLVDPFERGIDNIDRREATSTDFGRHDMGRRQSRIGIGGRHRFPLASGGHSIGPFAPRLSIGGEGCLSALCATGPLGADPVEVAVALP